MGLHIFPTVYRAMPRFKKGDQQVKLGVSEQDVNMTIQFKWNSNVNYPAVRVPSVEDMLSKLVVANHEYLEQRNNSNPRRRSTIDPDHSATKTATLGLAKSAHTRLMG